ncbi:hypothetical protein BGZ90_003637, partial [Linnemannia elongata]
MVSNSQLAPENVLQLVEILQPIARTTGDPPAPTVLTDSDRALRLRVALAFRAQGAIRRDLVLEGSGGFEAGVESIVSQLLPSPSAPELPSLEAALNALRSERLDEYEQQIYISPMAKASLQARDDDIFPLKEKVQEFLPSEQQVMLILGDSGSGKSTFNRYLEHELWTNYAAGPIPLFINLPELERPDKDLVAKHLRKIYFSEEEIRELRLQRQFVLICDGYDESQLTVNLHTANGFNRPGQWNVKMVISCRTQYLDQDYRSRFMPRRSDHYTRPSPHLFQEAVIAPFSKEQIKSYVDQYVPLESQTWTTKDFMDKLTIIPHLMDLVKNPFLLTLSLRALPNVAQTIEGTSRRSVTRAVLYDSFVEHWIQVGIARLRNIPLNSVGLEAFGNLQEDGFMEHCVEFQTNLAMEIFEIQEGRPIIQYFRRHDE